MEIKTIYTDRYVQTYSSWQLIFEWEDIFAEKLNLKIKDSRKISIITKYTSKACNFISRTFNISDHKLFSLFAFVDRFIYNKKALYIELNVKRKFYFGGSRNTVPIIIDFWKYIDLPTFYETYKHCPAVLITSLEAYGYLKENNCPLNIYHFPLSLPDKYKLSPDYIFEKPYDIIMQGRGNIVLWNYLQTYLNKYPRLECLWQIKIDDKMYCFSNKQGMIGIVEDRELYMQMMRQTKVSFYSTPGIDGGESRTGGFNPVTPRFLEMLGAGCEVIARYVDNEETKYYKMDSICTSADTYEIFEAELSKALQLPAPVKRNAQYLEMYYTTSTLALLKKILNEV